MYNYIASKNDANIGDKPKMKNLVILFCAASAMTSCDQSDKAKTETTASAVASAEAAPVATAAVTATTATASATPEVSAAPAASAAPAVKK